MNVPRSELMVCVILSFLTCLFACGENMELSFMVCLTLARLGSSVSMELPGYRDSHIEH